MRLTLALSLLATPALAWEFTPGPPCILTHDTGQAQVELTYDPTQPLYTITVTRAQTWPDAPIFKMRFEGPQWAEIGTGRHMLSDDRRSVTVMDRGFGNVLNGLENNRAAHAILGSAEAVFPLEDAAEPVRKFRACDIPLS
ncbi:MAG: hypothetical protein AB8B82_16740 [Roseovarius sp.]